MGWREAMVVLSAVAGFGCASTGTPGATGAATGDGSITVHNRSGYALFHLYLSAPQRNAWGDDLTHNHTFHNNTTLALQGVSCGRYDIRLLDEDGDECVLRDQSVCGEHGGLTLNGAEVATCPGWSPTAPPAGR